MHLPPWFWYAAVVLLSWGIVGILQKLSTNELSAEWAFFWLAIGILALQPWVYPGKAVLTYSTRALAWALLAGVFNALGAWALLAAMKSGGKASVVSLFTALYPLVVIFVAPFLLHERITKLQAAGVVCALLAVVLLSTEGPADASQAIDADHKAASSS
jgi:transporter family protein